MKRVVYLGNKAAKFDNVAQTGLTWTRGQVHEIEDEKKVAKLLEHPHVWADADMPHEMDPEIKAVEAPQPRVNIVPQGGEETTVFWDPIVVPVTGDIFKKIQARELETVFMSPSDAQAFAAWKAGQPAAEKSWPNMNKEERAAYQASKKAA